MGQISKFIVPNSIRIGATLNSTELSVTAVKTPDNLIVVVILNTNPTAAQINISYKSMNTLYTVPAHGISTLYFNDF
jgi:hypothetical protein